MTPVICLVGRSGAGKTTLLEKLIPELKKRGYRIATIKHAQEIDTDLEKDNARHVAAGSEMTALVSKGQIVAFKTVKQESSFAEAVRLIVGDYDIILCEGFKNEDAPKIEVHRKAVGTQLQGLSRLFAVVTDEPLDTEVRRFGFDEVKGLADLIENGFIKPQQGGVSLYVNKAPVALSGFPRHLVANTVTALIASLKGGEDIQSLDLSIKNAKAPAEQPKPE
jgi:molybdopterin-guanine dinucleotide biosynthesis protein B